MKRKYLNWSGWSRVPESTVTVRRVPGGVLTHLDAHEVREPLWITSCGLKSKILDAGYRWLYFYPDGAFHTLNAQCDASGRVMFWYVDIVAGHGVGADGVPWADDLYLDVVVTPGGVTQLLDADELDDALQAGLVTPAQFDLAWREVKAVLTAVRTNAFAPILAHGKHLALFDQTIV